MATHDWQTTFGRILEDGVGRHPDRTAITAGDRAVTYRELHQLSLRLARFLKHEGVGEGERVALVLPNGWSFVVATFAVAMTRAILVPLDHRIRPNGFEHICRDCTPRAVFLDEASLSRLGPCLEKLPFRLLVIQDEAGAGAGGKLLLNDILAAETDPTPLPEASFGEPVSISYTSGSTGTPKGVVHSHESWIASAVFTYRHFGVGAGDEILIPFPLHHAYAFRHILAYMMIGGTSIICENLNDGLRVIREARPAACLLVPDAAGIMVRFYPGIVEECREFLRIVSIGTAAISDEPLRELQALLPEARFHLPYGLTEGRVAFLRIEPASSERRIVAISPGMEVVLVGDDGRTARPGETGEICIGGAGLMLGYWMSGGKIDLPLTPHGFPTGDLGRLCENREIALIGRKDDILKVGGRKVHPQEVENVLGRHPAVHECVVLHSGAGEDALTPRLKALVVLRPGATARPSELLLHCEEYLEHYKVPGQIEFRQALAKSNVGKTLRRDPEEE